DHSYQRFAPQTTTGVADAAYGIREFVVGTGGAGLEEFVSEVPNTEVRNNSAHGVLKLTLRESSYEWEFIPDLGQTFADSGRARAGRTGRKTRSALTAVGPTVRTAARRSRTPGASAMAAPAAASRPRTATPPTGPTPSHSS